MAHPLAYASEDASDIMYYHDAIKQPDVIKFAKSIKKMLMSMWTVAIGSLFQETQS